MKVFLMFGAAMMGTLAAAAGIVFFLSRIDGESPRQTAIASAVESTREFEAVEEVVDSVPEADYHGRFFSLFGRSYAEEPPPVASSTPVEVAVEEVAHEGDVVDDTVPTTEEWQEVLEPEPEPVRYTLPYYTNRFGGWNTTWGIGKLIEHDVLDVRPTPDAYGAETLLLGSEMWKNYRYRAHLTISNGGVMLIARRDDVGNFVACNFWKNEITLLHHKNGETTTVDSYVVPDYPDTHYFEKDTWFSIRVQGNDVGCTMSGGGGDNLVRTIADMPAQGGIGIQTWYDDGPGAVSLQLREVQVEQL